MMEKFMSSQGYICQTSKTDVYIDKKSSEIADSISKNIVDAIRCSPKEKDTIESKECN